MRHSTRTRLARAVYRTGCQLGRIKTYQRYWELRPPVDGKFLPLPRRHAGRHWMACRLSTRCLVWAMRLDGRHFDHWALVHDDCDGGHECHECPDCGGHVDPPFDWPDEEDE